MSTGLALGEFEAGVNATSPVKLPYGGVPCGSPSVTCSEGGAVTDGANLGHQQLSAREHTLTPG